MPRFDVQRLFILAGWVALALIAYAT
jgi:VanZ family protein